MHAAWFLHKHKCCVHACDPAATAPACGSCLYIHHALFGALSPCCTYYCISHHSCLFVQWVLPLVVTISELVMERYTEPFARGWHLDYSVQQVNQKAPLASVGPQLGFLVLYGSELVQYSTADILVSSCVACNRCNGQKPDSYMLSLWGLILGTAGLDSFRTCNDTINAAVYRLERVSC